MTTPNPSSPISEKQRQQCMLYLLGELDTEPSATFQQELESSPELGDELLRQADLITALSQTSQRTVAPAVSTTMRWQIAASIFAVIAASFAFIVLGPQPNSPQRDGITSVAVANASVSEDLLIARAWADSHPIIDASEDLGFGDSLGDDSIAMAADDATDIDSTLSWMFIAVSANTDSQSSESANDG